MIVERAGRRIFADVVGDPAAPTAVIAIHGGPGFAHDYFRPGLDAVAGDGVAVVYVDLPGAGRASRHPGAGADLAPYIEDIAAVVARIGAPRTVLFGHAFGAILAVEHALTRPVDGLILVHPLRILSGEGQDAEAQARRVEAVDPSLFPDFAETLWPKLQAALGGDAGQWRAINADPWWSRMWETQLAAPPSDDWTRMSRAMAWGIDTYFDFKGAAFADPGHPLNGYDLAERARAVAAPALFFASDNDANYVAMGRTHAVPLAEAIAGSELVRMDHCGHFPFAEDPTAFAAAVTQFLARRLSPIDVQDLCHAT